MCQSARGQGMVPACQMAERGAKVPGGRARCQSASWQSIVLIVQMAVHGAQANAPVMAADQASASSAALGLGALNLARAGPALSRP